MNENTQYWINQGGIQTGPHTIEQLKEIGVTGEAYVWCAGMDDWKPITAVAELTELLPKADESLEGISDATPVSEQETQTHSVAIPPIPEQPLEPQPQYSQQTPPAVPNEQCPPTNLVWAILSTILCCIPLGIVAIIYSVKVSQKYQQGDIEGAKHYSEVSAWWCIGTIIGGIVLSPFVSLIQMAMMG